MRSKKWQYNQVLELIESNKPKDITVGQVARFLDITGDEARKLLADGVTDGIFGVPKERPFAFNKRRGRKKKKPPKVRSLNAN